MVTVAEFRALLDGASAYDIVREVLLDQPAAHVSAADILHIKDALSSAFKVEAADIDVVITGSAKLGFSLVEKRKRGQPTLPRYRLFSAGSDIDVAIISPAIFNSIWIELSSYYHRSVWFPQDTGKLGDYLVSGWLRPDHFPRHVRLPLCDNWWDTFRKLTKDRRFNRRRLNGGAFQSREHLTQYLARAVRECIALEITP